MQVFTLSERRDIIPVSQLEEMFSKRRQVAPVESPYRLDMMARRFPPPEVHESNEEKFAELKNRSELTSLDKMLRHLNLQETVMKKDSEQNKRLMTAKGARYHQLNNEISERTNQRQCHSALETRPLCDRYLRDVTSTESIAFREMMAILTNTKKRSRLRPPRRKNKNVTRSKTAKY